MNTFRVAVGGLLVLSGMVRSLYADTAVFIRTEITQGNVSYVQIVDADGRQTRYKPVFGAGGALTYIAYDSGRGDKRYFRVVPDTNGHVCFSQYKDASGAVRYQVDRNPPKLRGETLDRQITEQLSRGDLAEGDARTVKESSTSGNLIKVNPRTTPRREIVTTRPPPQTSGYNSLDDVGDSAPGSQIDIHEAAALLEDGRALREKGASVSGDDGGVVIDVASVGIDNVKNEDETRRIHRALPGDHAGRDEAAMHTGEVEDPLTVLSDTVASVSSAASGISDAINQVKTVKDQIEHWGDDGYTGPQGVPRPPGAGSPPQDHGDGDHMPPSSSGVAASRGTPSGGVSAGGITPTRIDDDFGYPPAPAYPPVKAPHSPAPALTEDVPDAILTPATAAIDEVAHPKRKPVPNDHVVYWHKNFLDADARLHFYQRAGTEGHDKGIIQGGFRTSSDAYKWLCARITITHIGQGGSESSRAIYNGKEYHVRADINAYCRTAVQTVRD